MSTENYNPYDRNISHIANFVAEASVEWVGIINNAQTCTAELNNIISKKLMTLYNHENTDLSKIVASMNAHLKGHTTGGGKVSHWTKPSTISTNISRYGMNMQVSQKEWDNTINQLQTTAQQQTSQMSAQGNDSNQASTSAGLMAQLMQMIVGLLQAAL